MGELYFPAGTYCLTSTMLFTDKSVTIRGDGPNLSILRYDAGGDGITMISTSGTNRVTLNVKSLSLVSNKAAVAAAIAGYWNDPATLAAPAASITDVQIKDMGVGLNWTVGIQLSNASRSVITNFNIDASSDVGDAAIRFLGQTLQATVTLGGITFWKDGIDFLDQSEGLHVDDVEIVGIHRGVVLDTTGILPGTSIANSHINARDIGIYMWQRNDTNISGNLIYATVTATNFVGIEAIHCNALRISGNYIVRLGSGGNYNGIELIGNTTRNVVTGNVTDSMDSGIFLTGTSVTASSITGNINRNFAVAAITDWSTPGANLFANNF
jgi:hypothetical protein